MKIERCTFNDDEALATATVTMTVDELAVLYRLAGHIAPSRVTRYFDDVRWGNALYTAAEGLGDIFDRFFDAGADDVIPNVDVYAEVAREVSG